MRYSNSARSHFVYPAGKPIIPHLLRYQGLAVMHYGFALGCLGSVAFSTFDQPGVLRSIRQVWRALDQKTARSGLLVTNRNIYNNFVIQKSFQQSISLSRWSLKTQMTPTAVRTRIGQRFRLIPLPIRRSL